MYAEERAGRATGARRDVDDRAAAGVDDMRDGGLAGEERALEIGIEDQVPFLAVDLQCRPLGPHCTSTINDIVELAEAVDGLSRRCLALVELGDVGDGRDHLALAERRQFLFGRGKPLVV